MKFTEPGHMICHIECEAIPSAKGSHSFLKGEMDGSPISGQGDLSVITTLFFDLSVFRSSESQMRFRWLP